MAPPGTQCLGILFIGAFSGGGIDEIGQCLPGLVELLLGSVGDGEGLLVCGGELTRSGDGRLLLVALQLGDGFAHFLLLGADLLCLDSFGATLLVKCHQSADVEVDAAAAERCLERSRIVTENTWINHDARRLTPSPGHRFILFR